MQKTQAQIGERRLVKPLTWDAGPLEANTTYIQAVDAQTGTVYFVEPFKSDFSGHRLWKAYCLATGAAASPQTIQDACDTMARRFKTLVQAKDACNRHATLQEWQETPVAIALTYRQYRLVERAIKHRREAGTTVTPRDFPESLLLKAIEKQVPPHYKQWAERSALPEPALRDEDAVPVLLPEPGFYSLFRCLSRSNNGGPSPEDIACLRKLRKQVFGKINAHEQRIVENKPASAGKYQSSLMLVLCTGLKIAAASGLNIVNGYN